MIFSVGYHKLKPGELLQLAVQLGACVVDCRSMPTGRVKGGFSREDLERLLPRYLWRGYELGGRVVGGSAGTTPAGLAWLAQETQRERLLLLCQEEAPGDCHRHTLIGLPLLKRRPRLVVRHVYFPERAVIDADDLQHSLDTGEPYPCEDLDEVLMDLGKFCKHRRELAREQQTTADKVRCGDCGATPARACTPPITTQRRPVRNPRIGR